MTRRGCQCRGVRGFHGCGVGVALGAACSPRVVIMRLLGAVDADDGDGACEGAVHAAADVLAAGLCLQGGVMVERTARGTVASGRQRPDAHPPFQPTRPRLIVRRPHYPGTHDTQAPPLILCLAILLPPTDPTPLTSLRHRTTSRLVAPLYDTAAHSFARSTPPNMASFTVPAQRPCSITVLLLWPTDTPLDSVHTACAHPPHM